MAACGIETTLMNAAETFDKSTSYVESSLPFPEKVSFDGPCGELCRCSSPTDVARLHDNIISAMDALCKRLSPTPKAAGVGMAGLLIASYSHRTKDADDACFSGGSWHFARIGTAKGTFGRHRADQIYKPLREERDPLLPEELPSILLRLFQ